MEIAWAAGLFDGEGCVHFAKDGRIAARLAMTDRSSVERFGQIIGVPWRCYVEKKRSIKWKTTYSWHVTRTPYVRQALAKLVPFLHTKRQAALKALAYLEHKRQWKL